jgi:hypothetical protein
MVGYAEIPLPRPMNEEDVIMVLISKAKIHMERYDIITNGTLDRLIRKGLITNQMATSLMNAVIMPTISVKISLL